LSRLDNIINKLRNSEFDARKNSSLKEKLLTNTTVRDTFWLWGREAGSPGGPPGNSRITAAEAAFYMDVPNLILVRFREPPVPPLDQYAVPLRPLKRVVWCITRLPSEITVSADERQQIIDLASRCDNGVGVIMDDLFNQLAEGGKPLLSVQELKDVRAQLGAAKRPLGVWHWYLHKFGFVW
jgi:hypothetical protein